MTETEHLPILYQFRLSMYPEKARWALDYKGIPHIRHNLLPGPHIPYMLRRFKQKATPVLEAKGQLIKDSTAILTWLEEQYPKPPLYPKNRQQRAKVNTLVEQYDEWGVHVRRSLFFDLLSDAKYAASAFTQDQQGLKHSLYRLAFPVTRIAMEKDMGITAKAAKASLQVVRQALDFTAEQTQKTGYLVGDHFTAADLTAATCLHCLCAPSQYPASFDEPKSARHQAYIDQWQEHPGSAWVANIYKQHRGQSAAVKEID